MLNASPRQQFGDYSARNRRNWPCANVFQGILPRSSTLLHTLTIVFLCLSYCLSFQSTVCMELQQIQFFTFVCQPMVFSCCLFERNNGPAIADRSVSVGSKPKGRATDKGSWYKELRTKGTKMHAFCKRFGWNS